MCIDDRIYCTVTIFRLLRETLQRPFDSSNWLWPYLHLRPEQTGHFVEPHVAALCGGDIYSRRKALFSSFGEHTAVCGSSVRQAVARPRHRQSVCIHNIHVAATCRPSVLGSATMRGHMWLNKVASVLGPLPVSCQHAWYIAAYIHNMKATSVLPQECYSYLCYLLLSAASVITEVALFQAFLRENAQPAACDCLFCSYAIQMQSRSINVC